MRRCPEFIEGKRTCAVTGKKVLPHALPLCQRGCKEAQVACALSLQRYGRYGRKKKEKELETCPYCHSLSEYVCPSELGAFWYCHKCDRVFWSPIRKVKRKN